VKKVLLVLVFLSQWIFAQEKYPVFPACKTITETQALQTCFNTELTQFLNTKLQEKAALVAYENTLNILFEIQKNGKFHVLYTDATTFKIDSLTKVLFRDFEAIKPATYGGSPFAKQFNFRYTKALENNEMQAKEEPNNAIATTNTLALPKVLKPIKNSRATYINIPFSHQNYNRFEGALNTQNSQLFTDVKPYLLSEVKQNYAYTIAQDTLQKETSTWLGRKLWNEHLLAIYGADYWFTLDPILDVRVGKNTNSQYSYTYLNQRGIVVSGGLGLQFNFYADIRESQGRFADYFNKYAYSLDPVGGYNAVIPGMGVATAFKANAFDFPVSSGYISYTPSKFFNFQFGQGKNFIGDGYRSLFLSDVASNYPYLKISTKFWKLKYTNLYMWLRDVRPEVNTDEYFEKKFVAIHNLSWQATKKLSLSFFESVVFDNYQGRGFEAGYFNPIIFYKTVELNMGSAHGNGTVGLAFKYKLKDNMQAYGQLVLDEFTLKDVIKNNGYWGNKFGYQLGGKYFDAFAIKGLNLQAELNIVRPYTYSHLDPLLNYGHVNQSLAHAWGANFKELTLIARYTQKRWFAHAQLTIGKKGFDYDNTLSYGGDIYQSYTNHFQNYGNTIAQGNTANISTARLNTGYLINPKTNLKAFISITARNFSPIQETLTFPKENTLWFQVGLRTDLGNWYF
jgi:hypothetical protein